MALPSAPNSISMSQVNVELSRTATATISLNETAVRNLAGVPSGTISMDNLRGKSAYTPMTLTFTGGLGEVFGGGCQTVSATATVSVAGGIGNFTYTWTRTSGATTPTSRSVTTASRSDSLTVSQFLCPNGEASSNYTVTVTDSTSASVSITVSYSLIHFGS